MSFLEVFQVGFEFKTVLLEDFTQLAQVLHNEIGVSRPQLREGVVAREHGAGMDAAMARGLDVMLHIANEQCLPGIQLIFFQDIVDFFSLVPNPQVRFVEVFIKSDHGSLDCEMILMDSAEQKCPQVLGAAKLKEFSSVRQLANGTLDLLEAAMKPAFELGQWHVWQVPVVKNGERKAKLGAELLKAHLRAL